MTYIRRIALPNGFRNIPSIEIALEPKGEQPFRHLILTGPNGSGKSSLLEALASNFDDIRKDARSNSRPVVRDSVANVHWDESEFDIMPKLRFGKSMLVYLKAQRSLRPLQVQGPRTLEFLEPNMSADFDLSKHFLQFLVNLQTERAFAQMESDDEAVQRIGKWFETFTEYLRRIMADPDLVLRFERNTFSFLIRRSNGFEFSLGTLADGHASVLSIMAELFLRIETCQKVAKDRSYQPDGVVVVDEIETHLHLHLQELVLPFLTELMPQMQFIVATHSPAVISSIPNAMVYDLGTHVQVLSDDLRGIRYGTLMTEHFRIESDMDLDSTEKLKRAQALIRKQVRTQEEERQLSAISAELSARSSNFALQLWETKEEMEGRND